MDIEEALKVLRELAHKLADSDDMDVAEFAITFQGLDGWLTRGGFPPKDWENKSHD